MSATVEGAPLLTVRDLQKFYVGQGGGLRRRATEVRALDGISFEVRAGETFGLVGESGCGKSTAARCLLRLVEPTGGSVTFDGIELRELGDAEMRRLRRRMQMVFQDPTGSLDPRMSVGDIVEEPLKVHRVGSAEERARRAEQVLETVGLDASALRRRPHEFSGGQRQRIGIARALTLDPDLIVLDEPVSALDVSVQAQVLNLLSEIQAERGLTYVFIVHDLAVAEHFCDNIAVLYLGQVMELGSREQLFERPRHPYTVALLSAVPEPDVAEARDPRRRIVLEGEVSQQAAGEGGCPFRARCPVGRDRNVCREVKPPLAPAERGGAVACHFPGELS